MSDIPKVKRLLKEEFCLNPIGHHSQELQRVLNIMRGEPVIDRYVLISIIPHRKWMLGKLSGERGKPVNKYENIIFSSIHDAERYVFELREQRHAARLEELELTE